MIDFKKLQKDVYQNKVNHGFNVTDLNMEFCLAYGELGEDYIKEECEHILLGRFSEVEEIAKEIYHVAVESTYLNDSVIKVDGGRC